MAQDVWETNEIEVVSGFLTTRHRLGMAAGGLGEFTFPALRRRATFRAADGRELLACNVSFWHSHLELREGDRVLAIARPPSFWSRALTISFSGREYAQVRFLGEPLAVDRGDGDGTPGDPPAWRLSPRGLPDDY